MDPSYNQRLAGPENQFLLNDVVPGKGMTVRGSRKLPTGAEGYEKQPLFERAGSAEPVRLTPAWEETNLPNDELNFKGVTMERADLEMNPPIDRLKLVYLTFVLHGVGTLMPWNMFINAKSYFVDYKLGKEYLGSESVYASNFLAYVGFAAQIPNLLFNWLNIFIKLRGNLTTRIVWSIFVEVLVFIVTVILAMSDTSSWPGAFFFVTMGTIVLLNMACGIYQNTVYGMAAKLPFKYTGAVILGARFYRYHELLSQKEQQSKECQAVGRGTPQVPYFQIFKQCFPQLFNVFFVFFVTLSLFPAVNSDIKLSSPDFIISKEYFTEVTCFLTFNVCAMLGSLLSTVLTWPKPQHLVFPVVLRVLFIPFFLVCKYEPQNRIRQFPVFIPNDWVYWIASMLFGISSGHLSALGMMYCPRSVEPQYAAIAGMFGAAVLITGIFSGIVFTFAFPEFVVGVPWNL